jgi:nicotinamide-nucleotide amidase
MDPEEADTRLNAVARQLLQAAGEHAYGVDDADLASVVLEQLRRASPRHRLAVAESCTGGLVGARITAIPGASDTFMGGVVAYADVVKTTALQVPMDTLAAHGAVSEETVCAMAEGAQRLFAVDTSIAVTGIAGPGGGTPEKPVGTVWLAARVHDRVRAIKRVFPGDRDEIRARAAQGALDLLRRELVRG